MKKSFIIYDDFLNSLEGLNDKEFREIFRNIQKFRNGEKTNISGALAVIFNIYKNQLIRDENKYKAKCLKNKENIEKRWNTNVYERIRTDTKHTDNDNVNDNDTVNDTDKGNDKDKEKIHTCFEEFWSLYPKRKGRKVGKQTTKAIFKRKKLYNGDYEDLMKAVKNYSKEEFPKDPERFLKNDYWKEWVEEISINISNIDLEKPNESYRFKNLDLEGINDAGSF